MKLNTSITNKSMDSRIRQYDRIRMGGAISEGWVSEKFPIQDMGWSAMKGVYIPELSMSFGQACSALKKSWRHYRILGREGAYRDDIGWRIQRIQQALGLERTQFEDQQSEEDEEEWSLKQEETGEFDVVPQSEEERALLEEERKENDDWDSW